MNIEHLRKQAKDLLRLYRRQDPAALARLRTALPAARGKTDSALIAMQLRLHDMQSCIARELGFASWPALKDDVELRHAKAQDARAFKHYWLRLVYGGDVAGGPGRAKPAIAARVLEQHPELAADDSWLACAIGNETALEHTIASDPGWVNRAGGLLNIPPIIAVTHSGFARLDSHRESLRRCLKLLLDRGADPNASIGNRWPPHSLEKPASEKLTAIYGAAGKLHDERMTTLLLAAGADANDGESLYHSLEDPRPELPCTRLLLEAGTRVAGTNALAKVLDVDNLAGLRMLLAHTGHGDPDLGRILHWAICRGRSAAHVRAILDAGADPRALDRHDVSHHAASFALPEVMRLLEKGGTGEPLTVEEKFVAACARADDAEARRLRLENPDIFARLSPAQLKQLPLMAMSGRDDAVRLMVELGWPIGERGGDIDGSALNWAVFRGNPALTEFLLAHGASFREPHGYGSDVLGTLGWASINTPRSDGDWAACAASLLQAGLPVATIDPFADQLPDFARILIDGRTMTLPREVAEVLIDPGT